MKVSATLKGSLDSLGRRTVYIRIVHNGKRKFYATGIKLEPKYWKKKVIGPDSKRLNDQIKSLILSYESSPVVSDINFYKYCLTCLSEWEQTKKPSTIKSLTNRIKKFKEFSDCKITSVTPELLKKYAVYCTQLGNKQSTVWGSLKAVRTFIYKAWREKVIVENPFLVYKMPTYQDPQKIYLTKDQVETIESKLPELDNLKTAAVWFLISCYTGLRFGDQQSFTKSKIRDGRLIVYTSKTGKVISLPLNDKLKELFKLVDYKPLPYTNEHYNRLIKAVAAVCGIKENISAHTARHTFGTLCASAGISQEVAAALMGHSSIRTTAIYYQITGTRIDGEFSKLF